MVETKRYCFGVIEIERYAWGEEGMVPTRSGTWMRYPKHIVDKRVTRQIALADAAFFADQVESTARPGDGKDAASEIGRRIRALMEGTR